MTVALIPDDADLDAQLGRTLAAAHWGCADVGETLACAGRAVPGDYDRWYDEWSAVAERSETRAAAAEAAGHRVSARGGYLRASEYWRQAWFFLRHDIDDERLLGGWRRHRDTFRAALPLLPHHGRAVAVPYEDIELPGYLICPDDSGAPRPTVIAPCGYDSTAEAAWPATGAMAVARGYNLFTFEGPGQGGTLYEHRRPFRPDFEAVLTPAVDWLHDQPGVDPARTALVARSFAGYLGPRGAAAEHRIAALVADPGQVEFSSRAAAQMGPEMLERVRAQDPQTEADLQGLLDDPRGREWWGARMASHQVTTVAEMIRALDEFTCEAQAPSITCPTLVTEGEGDFASQSQALYDLLTCDKQLLRFDTASGAGGHCEGMGATLFAEAAFDWLDGVLDPGS